MILADTSVWIGHLRSGDPTLAGLLEKDQILAHPCVVGELACGNLRNRSEVLRLLQNLSQAPTATHDEALQFIEQRHLMGRGIGYVDVHLLASAVLGDVRLWTADRRLRRIYEQITRTH